MIIEQSYYSVGFGHYCIPLKSSGAGV